MWQGLNFSLGNKHPFIFWRGASSMFCFCVGFPFFLNSVGFPFAIGAVWFFLLTDLSFANFRVASVFLCVLPLCFWLVAGGAFSLLIVATWCGSYMGSFSWSFESCTFFRFPFRWIWGWKTFFFVPFCLMDFCQIKIHVYTCICVYHRALKKRKYIYGDTCAFVTYM